MSHTAFEFAVGEESLPSPIAAMSLCGNMLYVALQDCTLLRYRFSNALVNPGPTDELASCNVPSMKALEESIRSYTKKPLMQLSVINSDSEQYIVHLQSDGTLTMNGGRAVIKNVTLYTLAAYDEFRVDLAICIKKKLQLWTLDSKQKAFVQTKEFGIVDVPKSVTFFGRSGTLCLGFKKEFVALQSKDGEVKEIFATGSRSSCVVGLYDTAECVLAKDLCGFVIAADTSPARKHGLSWTDSPSNLIYVAPYLLALEPGLIEVHMHYDTSLVQTIPIRGGCIHSLTRPNDPVVCVATNGGDNGDKSTTWSLLRAVPLHKQIDVLLTKKKFEDAVRLCDYMMDDPSSLDESAFAEGEERTDKRYVEQKVHLYYAYHLFKQSSFEAAMAQFAIAKVSPDDVLALYSSYTEGFPNASTDSIQALTKFLSNHRNGTSKVDDALLACHIRTGPSNIPAFFKMKSNACSVAAVREMLLAHNLIDDLILFYSIRGLHEDAIELIVDHVTPEAVAKSKIVKYCIEQSLAGQDDIILRAVRFLGIGPDAMKVLVSPSVSLSKPEVLAAVRSFLAPSPSDLKTFCKYYVQDRKSQDPELHDELVLIMLKSVIDATPHASGTTSTDFLKKRKELQLLLATSEYFHAQKVLMQFPFDQFLEERALILARMGAHEDVLEIYAHRLKRHDLVELYCRQKNTFRIALEVYLRPQNARDSLQHAMNLLTLNFGQAQAQVSYRDVLSMCPEEVPVHQILPYFDALLSQNESKRKELKVVASLWKQESQRVREELVKEQARFVRIGSERGCRVCGKRIGGSVFAVYPHNEVVHFSCLRSDPKSPLKHSYGEGGPGNIGNPLPNRR
eukprot:ANDGO_07369.mRNA.1 Vacuolar morphogenesis protein 6